MKYSYNLRWLILALFIFVLDQSSKWIACQYLALYHSVNVLPFFSLYLTHNTGAAFSFLSDANGWQRWFFSVFAGLVGVFIIMWLYRLPRHHSLMAIALALILGGALGNVWDRLFLGYVIDFLLLHWHQFQWPVFNIADSAICIGAVLLFFCLCRRSG